MNVGAPIAVPIQPLYGRQVPLTNESGEPVQLAEGDKVMAEVAELKPDGTLMLKMPNGQQLLAETLADRTFVPGQRVMLTVTETRGGVPMAEITGEGASSAETFLKAMKVPVNEPNLALARESLLQQAPFTPKQFAALAKTVGAFENLPPEQAVFMARHNIPVNRESVARYQAVTKPQAQLGALLERLLDILPAGRQAPQTVSVREGQPPQAAEQTVQLPQAGTARQTVPQPAVIQAPSARSDAPSPPVQSTLTPAQGASAPQNPQPQQITVQPPISGETVIQPQPAQIVKEGQPPQPAEQTVQLPQAGPSAPPAVVTGSDAPPPAQAAPLGQTAQNPPSAQQPQLSQPSQPSQFPQSAQPLQYPQPSQPSSLAPSPSSVPSSSPSPSALQPETVQISQAGTVRQTVPMEPVSQPTEVPSAARPRPTATPPTPAEPQPSSPPPPPDPPSIRELLETLFAKVSPARSRELPWDMDAPKQTREIGRLLTSVIETARDLPQQQRTELISTAREIVQTLRFTEQINHCTAFAQLPITVNGERTTAQLYVFNDSTETKKIDPQNATLFVSLNTANLGTVEGFIKVIGAGVEADFSLRTEEAASLFRAGLPELSDLLEARGYRLERVTAAVGQDAEPLPPAAVEKGRAARAGRYRFNRTV